MDFYCKYPLLLALLYSTSMPAQPDGLHLFSTGGGMTFQGSTFLSYSIGEPSINETFSSGNWITEGFQQPDAVDLTTGIHAVPGNYIIDIHPNPVSSSLFINGIALPKCDVHIVDILGHVVLSGILHDSGSPELSVTTLSPGLYYLHVIHQQTSIATTPFIKI